jgi:hypothetical protein
MEVGQNSVKAALAYDNISSTTKKITRRPNRNQKCAPRNFRTLPPEDISDNLRVAQEYPKMVNSGQSA